MYMRFNKSNMTQYLDVISINIYSILVSLANLVILFLILKKFLYKPVKKILAERKAQIDEQYKKAEEAENVANNSKLQWEEKLKGADAEADQIIKAAEINAERRKDVIISDANKKAEVIMKHAKDDAEAELVQARQQIRNEIADVSYALAEKILEREIKIEDHRDLVDSFIDEVGDNNG